MHRPRKGQARPNQSRDRKCENGLKKELVREISFTSSFWRLIATFDADLIELGEELIDSEAAFFLAGFIQNIIALVHH